MKPSNQPESKGDSAMVLREQSASQHAPLEGGASVRYAEVSWERMIRAVEKVRERLNHPED